MDILVISVWPLPKVENWFRKQIWNENVHISILKFFFKEFRSVFQKVKKWISEKAKLPKICRILLPSVQYNTWLSDQSRWGRRGLEVITPPSSLCLTNIKTPLTCLLTNFAESCVYWPFDQLISFSVLNFSVTLLGKDLWVFLGCVQCPQSASFELSKSTFRKIQIFDLGVVKISYFGFAPSYRGNKIFFEILRENALQKQSARLSSYYLVYMASV